MKLGSVLGAVWATKKCPALAGQIFMRVDCEGEQVVGVAGEVVVDDYAGAGSHAGKPVGLGEPGERTGGPGLLRGGGHCLAPLQ